MDLLEYDINLAFDKLDTNYIEIILKDQNYCNGLGDHIEFPYVENSLKEMTFGYINISKKKSQRDLDPKHYKYSYVESSSEEDDEEILHSKIKVNGYIICRIDEFNEMNIDVLYSNLKGKGLGKTFMNLILEYCRKYDINTCRLTAISWELTLYYQKFGFVQTHRVLDNYYMCLKFK